MLHTLRAAALLLCLVCGCYSTNAQVVKNKSEDIERQIKLNADAGLDEYHNILTQYTFTFSDQIDPAQFPAMDQKLIDLNPDLILSSQTTQVAGLNRMVLTTSPLNSYADVKMAAARYGLRFTNVEQEYILSK